MPKPPVPENLLWVAASPLINQDQHDMFMPGFITVPSCQIFNGCEVYLSQQAIDIQFTSDYLMQGSAMINGGLVDSRRYIMLEHKSLPGTKAQAREANAKQLMSQYLQQCTLVHSASAHLHCVANIATSTMHSCSISSDQLEVRGQTIRFFVLVLAEESSWINASYNAQSANLDSPDGLSLTPRQGLRVFFACDKPLDMKAQSQVLALISEAKVLAQATSNKQKKASSLVKLPLGSDHITIASPKLKSDLSINNLLGMDDSLAWRIRHSALAAMNQSLKYLQS